MTARHLVLLSLALLLCPAGHAAAQITLDGSLGPERVLRGPDYRIPARLGQIRGGNLFHSFERFNVEAGESATFVGPRSITSIIGRVTGGQRSTVDGLLRSEIQGANLFLINPAGVLFGPGASLDVTGSFHVSTANYLELAGSGVFHADLARQSVLTAAPVSAFGFLGTPVARIDVQGSRLEISEGQTLSLVGGDLSIVSSLDAPTLAAPAGTIQLAGVSSAGEVPIDLRSMALDTFPRLGAIAITGFLDASGDGGGAVVIRGGQLMVDSSLIFADNHGSVRGVGPGIDIAVAGDATVGNASRITTDGVGSGRARDIRIAADTLRLDHGDTVIASRPFASGAGGNVTVEARNVTLVGGARISGETFDAGKGGVIRITASEALRVDAGQITADAFGSGRAASIVVEAGNVTVSNGGRIASDTTGAASGGRVQVTARDTVAVDGAGSQISAATDGPGRGGDVLVRARRVELTNEGKISTDTFGPGEGGAVRVDATETVTVNGDFNTGIFADASGSGDGGDIVVTARNLTMTGGARIASDAFDDGGGGTVRVAVGDTVSLHGSQIAASTSADGRGGEIVVTAGEIVLRDRGKISSDAFGAGGAGRVQVTARGALTIHGTDTGIFADAVGSGDSGDVVVAARNIALTGGAKIASDTHGSGDGGTVTVTADDTVSLGSRSGISTSSSGDGAGGRLTLQADTVDLRERASVSATSSAGGDAGDILIRGRVFRSADGSVTTEADFADGGNIALEFGELVELVDSRITTTVRSGLGSGGNISIDPTFVVLNHSQITANAFGGPGGNITIVADVFLPSADSRITASSALSTQGSIAIEAPLTDLTGSLASPLPGAILQAASLLQQSCATRHAGGKSSSLVVGGRDGVPPEPGGFAPSPLGATGSEPARSTGASEPGFARLTFTPATNLLSLDVRCAK
jgi:filamentous hemagglutinin family protein